jgi:hypothetical protein
VFFFHPVSRGTKYICSSNEYLDLENFLENFPITEKVDYRDSTSKAGEYKKKNV